VGRERTIRAFIARSSHTLDHTEDHRLFNISQRCKRFVNVGVGSLWFTIFYQSQRDDI